MPFFSLFDCPRVQILKNFIQKWEEMAHLYTQLVQHLSRAVRQHISKFEMCVVVSLTVYTVLCTKFYAQLRLFRITLFLKLSIQFIKVTNSKQVFLHLHSCIHINILFIYD